MKDYPIGSRIDHFGCYFGVWPATVTGHGPAGTVRVMVHVTSNTGRVVDIPLEFDRSRGPDIRPKEAQTEPLTDGERRIYTMKYLAGRSIADPLFERVREDGTAAKVNWRARSPRDYDGRRGLPWGDVRGRYWPISAAPEGER